MCPTNIPKNPPKHFQVSSYVSKQLHEHPTVNEFVLSISADMHYNCIAFLVSKMKMNNQHFPNIKFLQTGWILCSITDGPIPGVNAHVASSPGSLVLNSLNHRSWDKLQHQYNNIVRLLIVGRSKFNPGRTSCEVDRLVYLDNQPKVRNGD